MRKNSLQYNVLSAAGYCSCVHSDRRPLAEQHRINAKNRFQNGRKLKNSFVCTCIPVESDAIIESEGDAAGPVVGCHRASRLSSLSGPPPPNPSPLSASTSGRKRPEPAGAAAEILLQVQHTINNLFKAGTYIHI